MATKKSSNYNVSARCLLYKNIETPLTQSLSVYLVNKYDEEDNPQGIINMGTSENKIITDVVLAKLNERNVFKEEHTHYGDFSGLESLRVSLAAFFHRYLKPLEKINPNRMIVTNGAASALKIISAAIADPGEAILIPTPYYGGFDMDLEIENEIVRFPVHLSSKPHPVTKMPFELTMEDLENALTKAKEQNLKVRALLICNPINPLGTVYTEEQVLACMEFAHRHSLHLISDELYMLSIFGENVSMTSALAVKGPLHPNHVHLIWGFSKDFGLSGIRTGVLYTRNKEILSAMTKTLPFYSLAQYVQEMLENIVSDFDWLDKVMIPTNHMRLRECHSIVTAALKEQNIPVVPSCSGLYVWIDLRAYLTPANFEGEQQLANVLMDNGVYINTGKSFNCVEPGWFRVVFASDLNMIKKGIERVVQTLQIMKAKL